LTQCAQRPGRDERRRLAAGERVSSAPVIVTDAVSDYLRGLRPTPDPVLADMEAHGARDGVPIVVPEVGELLHVLALGARARRIVEVGTAIGVSTLYLARALPDHGVIVSFEVDPGRHAAARGYLDRAGLLERADLRLQDAREGLGELAQGSFEFAFLDGVKAQYGDYLELVIPLLARSGVLAIDNVLMGGTVAEGRGDGNWTDEQIAGMREFTVRLLADERLTGTVMPVGDGVLVAVRR
jgi:predicted O-methyltransferase YrrM